MLPTRAVARAGVRTLMTSACAGAPSTSAEHRRPPRAGRDGGRRGLPRRPLPPFQEWVRGDGEQYRYPAPQKGPHWVASTPFPLNPAFRPPPPVHQSVRDEMWRLHTEAPAQWTVRALADKYRVSLAKAEAVLRLKALEEEFVHEGKPLQTELQRHMERLLGARASAAHDAPAVPETRMHSPRGAPYEEMDESTSPGARPSALAAAIRASNEQHKATMARVPTGGPTGVRAERTVAAAAPHRAPLQVCAVGADSYRGVGHVERNRKRAAHRAQQRARRRARSEA